MSTSGICLVTIVFCHYYDRDLLDDKGESGGQLLLHLSQLEVLLGALQVGRCPSLCHHRNHGDHDDDQLTMLVLMMTMIIDDDACCNDDLCYSWDKAGHVEDVF